MSFNIIHIVKADPITCHEGLLSDGFYFGQVRGFSLPGILFLVKGKFLVLFTGPESVSIQDRVTDTSTGDKVDCLRAEVHANIRLLSGSW